VSNGGAVMTNGDDMVACDKGSRKRHFHSSPHFKCGDEF